MWFFDSDDWAESTALEDAMNECTHDESDIILCNYRIYSERKDSYEERINKLNREKNFFRACLGNKLKSNIWGCLYRNEFHRSHFGTA